MGVQDTRVIPLQLISRRHDHGAWCSRAAPRAVQRWPGGSAHHWHPVPCRAVAGRTPIGALLRCRGSSGGGGAGAMRLPRMRREWARPRRPRGHSALLMVAHQGPPIAMYPPHTSASASTPAHAGASSLRASAASCFCSAASSRSCRRSRQPLLRLRLLWRLLTAPPARAGVPAVPDLRRQGHEVQPKRPDARRDRLQEAPQPVRESARYGPETQGAASTMLCQVAERSARACAPRARRLWAALGGSGQLGTRGGRAEPAHARRLQGRRSHPPPLSLLLHTTPGTRRADTTATTATLETARPPGALCWRPCGPGAHAWRRPCPARAAACVARAPW